ncbi:MAG: hypothetical protein ACYC25_16060 [Paludibacter sp.]
MSDRYILKSIPGVKEETALQIRALASIDEDGNVRSKALSFLYGLARSNPEDYAKIMASIISAAKNGFDCGLSRLKPWDKKNGIYEFTAPRCGVRLFGFTTPENTMLICYNFYDSKCGPNRGRSKGQTRAFETCYKKKIEYYKELYSIDI